MSGFHFDELLEEAQGFYRMLSVVANIDPTSVRLVDMLPPHHSVTIGRSQWERLGAPSRIRVELTALPDAAPEQTP